MAKKKRKPETEMVMRDLAIWCVDGTGMGVEYIQADGAAEAIHTYNAWCTDSRIGNEIKSVTRVCAEVIRLRPIDE